jgi:hypothetical protein
MHIITKRGSIDNQITYEHYCDTITDMNDIDKSTITLGSTCIVVNGTTGLEFYIADSQKQWHAV